MKSLERALALLEVFSDARGELGVTEISQLTSLPKSTVVRILKTLEKFHYVTQSDTKKYRLGSSAIRLGRTALRSIHLRTVAKPVMEGMARVCGETILLMILNEERNKSICIERVESQRGIRLSVEIGKQMYLHAGASAKALLAFLRDEEIRRVIQTVGLPRVARNTITDVDALWGNIREIRENGYSESVEETDEGAAGVGAPILAEGNGVIGAVAIAGPIDRMMRRREENISLVQEAANRIASFLGFARTSLKGGSVQHA